MASFDHYTLEVIMMKIYLQFYNLKKKICLFYVYESMSASVISLQ